ncbi:gluconate:H+ symporter (GntP) family transporter [Gemella sanguinis M325]|jgi:gnt-II system L-idonate transporter|uniref:Gluconate permease n=1 Tax=Gemella sanguinis TaxID=84135 RepID=A0ABX6FJS2_9BACL|nr:gluconate:H+ symporter [Gemella sanguinis]EGF85926.1 gluconate:H+ symporter (GntP) family transporter [Gemella sanguinis M325]QGS08265.1 gluconate permease [Gemella sanguinis]
MKFEKVLISIGLIFYIIIASMLGIYSYKLLLVFLGISTLIFLITKLNFEPFLSILIVAIVLGLFLGLSPNVLIDSIEKGTGSLLGHLSLILGLGAMFGRVLEELGAVEITAKKMISIFGVKRIQLGLLIAGMCISFSLFFDVAFILVIPIILSVAKELKLEKIYVALPASIGILTIHALFPPHPSPSIITKTFNLNMAEAFFYGLIVAIPTALIGGLLLTNSRIIKTNANNSDLQNKASIFEINNKSMSSTFAIVLMLLPVLLITIPTIILGVTNLPELIKSTLIIISNPVTALLISLLIAIVKLMISKKLRITSIVPLLSESIKTIAVVLLINGAAGGLKQVLVDSKVTDEIVRLTNGLHLSPIIISFFVAAILRISLGSATIAAITTLAIVEPLVPNITYSAVFIMLSIASGSMFCSHVNDPGFWLFKQYLNLDFKTTFKTWTLGTTLSSLIAFIIILIITSLT